MNKVKMFFMRKKPTMLDFVGAKMTKDAKTVFQASFDDARKEQNRVLKAAKALDK